MKSTPQKKKGGLRIWQIAKISSLKVAIHVPVIPKSLTLALTQSWSSRLIYPAA